MMAAAPGGGHRQAPQVQISGASAPSPKSSSGQLSASPSQPMGFVKIDEERLARAIAGKVTMQLQAQLTQIEGRLGALLAQPPQGRMVTQMGMMGKDVGWHADFPHHQVSKMGVFGDGEIGRFHSAPRALSRSSEASSMYSQLLEQQTSCWMGESDNKAPSLMERMDRFAKLPEPPRAGMLADLINSQKFANMGCIVIGLNTAFICIMTNDSARRQTHDLTTNMKVIELFFILYYLMELILRLCVHRCFFFWNEDWAWNTFDFIIVACGVIEFLMTVGKSSINFNVTWLRLGRVLKVSRMSRVFKAFRFLVELRVMAACVLGSMFSLMWACLFMIAILMVAALVLVQDLTNYRIKHCIDASHMSQESCKNIKEWFGSVTDAMLSLFQATTGGNDWGEYFGVIRKCEWITGFFFMAYIVFFNFAFFNIVTSMFVDKAMKLAKPDEDYLVMERKREEAEMTKDLEVLFDTVDEDDSGKISLQELKCAAQDAHTFHKFEILGITLRDAETFFTALSAMSDEDGELSKDSFVNGCLKMKGPASSLDVQAMQLQMREWSENMKNMKTMAPKK